jgi:hypothetical protein
MIFSQGHAKMPVPCAVVSLSEVLVFSKVKLMQINYVILSTTLIKTHGNQAEISPTP